MADKVAPEVKPFSADDIHEGRTGQAPPSYEEVMGQFATSVNSSQSAELPALAYIDITPRMLSPGNADASIPPVFEEFDKILVGANMWLRANPGLQVWKCEAINKDINIITGPDGQSASNVDLQSMYIRMSLKEHTGFVFALRLWLCPKPAGEKGVQQLGIVHVIPDTHQAEVASSRRRQHRSMRLLNNTRTLKQTMDTFNEKIKEHPIPGKILTIQSVPVRFSPGASEQEISRAANAGSWYDLGGARRNISTMISRIYYVKGPKTTPQIRVEEFMPVVVTSPSSDRHGKLQTFEDLLVRAQGWLQTQEDPQIVGLESREEGRSYFSFADACCFFLLPCAPPKVSQRRLRYLRVFCITDSAMSSMAPTCMTSRLFKPVPLGGTQYETMTETMARIDAWLKVVGLPILSVETFYHPRDSRLVANTDSSYEVPKNTLEMVITIRVFFGMSFVDPDPEASETDRILGHRKLTGS